MRDVRVTLFLLLCLSLWEGLDLVLFCMLGGARCQCCIIISSVYTSTFKAVSNRFRAAVVWPNRFKRKPI